MEILRGYGFRDEGGDPFSHQLPWRLPLCQDPDTSVAKVRSISCWRFRPPVPPPSAFQVPVICLWFWSWADHVPAQPWPLLRADHVPQARGFPNSSHRVHEPCRALG